MAGTKTVTLLIQEAQRSFDIQHDLILQLLVDTGHETQADNIGRTLHMMLHYLCDRGRTVLFLVANDFDWDAEIVLRSYYECAAKILFIALSPPSEQGVLVEEFWVPLGEAADRQTARKAGYAEDVFPRDDQNSRDVFRLLRQPVMIRDTLKLTKADRKRLGQKWSFSELIESLSRLKLGDGLMTGIRSLLHLYGMASHLAHADCNAMDLMSNRALRPSAELQLLQDAHAARIITDVVSIGTVCSDLIGKHLHVSHETLGALRRQMETVMSSAKPISESFYASQRSFYDEMLKSSQA